MTFHIKKATTQDAKRLSEITWQSKAHWNYPKEWMELWRKGLAITQDTEFTEN